jgi:hypothetical protein
VNSREIKAITYYILEITNSYVLHRVIVISKRTKKNPENGIQIPDMPAIILIGQSAVPGQADPYVRQSGGAVSRTPDPRTGDREDDIEDDRKKSDVKWISIFTGG